MAANLLIVSGEKANILERLPAGALTCSPAASTDYPLVNLYDSMPVVPFRFGSNVADPMITADLGKIVADGGFETVGIHE